MGAPVFVVIVVTVIVVVSSGGVHGVILGDTTLQPVSRGLQLTTFQLNVSTRGGMG
jgi:NAD(P)H-dependent FMN reductase